jgi:hypothetical protein
MTLTPVQIQHILSQVVEGVADPDDARRLLESFCESSERNIRPDLLAHFQAAFRVYLSGAKSLEAALGLTRKRGRPKADDERRHQLALELLKCRLAGASHEDAVVAVSERLHRSASIIKEAWTSHRHEAVLLLRYERLGLLEQNQGRWAGDELARLAEIFKNDTAFIPPGKSPK